ncbi:unnamed protein product, partial [Prorocentrum cordatum]
VTWLLESTADEIRNMSMSDNIQQHTRRRHSEIENIFQVANWMRSMPACAPQLDANKAIDVVKFALTMGDPLR